MFLLFLRTLKKIKLLPMKKVSLLFTLCFLVTSLLQAQKDTDVLMTIDGETVLVQEFMEVYNKNLELVQDEGQKELANYIELFIDYKLKTKEAFAQGLDNNAEFKKEFTKYQEQLSQSFLYDQEITDELLMQAYNRLAEEINANHILLQVTPTAKPSDTLAKYNQIKAIRDRAIQGEDFEALAREYSEEPSAKERAGYLGYFKGFAMVYPFENAAYNTSKGQISEIVRTQYGYHIIKVNDRRKSPDELTVAHIMVSTQGEDVTPEEAEKRINDIYKRIQQGENFDDLVSLSDDVGTARNKGIIGRFGSGKLNAPNFEAAAFALENIGDISAPVKSRFGWHIIKLLEKHPMESFEELKEMLEKRVKEGDRGKVITQTVNQRIKDKYGFTKDEDALAFFYEFVTDTIAHRKWTYDANHPKLKETIFSIGNNATTYGEFAEYIATRQKRGALSRNTVIMVNMYYPDFEEQKLKEFYMSMLEKENRSYASVVNEYRNGLLIYDLMNKNIWEPSKTDTLGLEKFFQQNRQKYTWKKRVDAVIASVSDKNQAENVQQLLMNGVSSQSIEEQLNTDDKIVVMFTSGLFEIDHQALPENFNAQKGVSQIYYSQKNPEKSAVVVLVNDVLPEQQKSLEDVRGKVMSDYQNHLEAMWMKELRDTYSVSVNKKVLKKLTKKEK
jgi:peptidyl-prolyl cis-trans isomerase SurA